MNVEISIGSSVASAGEVKTLLEQELRDESKDIELRVVRYRLLETTILVAIVSALGVTLGALISGLLRIAEQKGAAKIILCGRSGRRIEVSAGASPEQLRAYVELARELDIERIEF
jgi:hypothetical protein